METNVMLENNSGAKTKLVAPNDSDDSANQAKVTTSLVKTSNTSNVDAVEHHQRRQHTWHYHLRLLNWICALVLLVLIIFNVKLTYELKAECEDLLMLNKSKMALLIEHLANIPNEPNHNVRSVAIITLLSRIGAFIS